MKASSPSAIRGHKYSSSSNESILLSRYHETQVAVPSKAPFPSWDTHQFEQKHRFPHETQAALETKNILPLMLHKQQFKTAAPFP